jgi:anti-sigma28 factor (negative regulator of flagellin synthesis)
MGGSTMTVDNINKIGSHPAVTETPKETKIVNKKIEKKGIDTYSKVQNNSVKFSPEAKKLQETEKILRFALEKLETLDEIRADKLDDVREKVDNNFYMSEDVISKVSDKIISGTELQNKIKLTTDVENYLQKIKEIDSKDMSVNLNYDKVDEIKSKIANGYYDSPEIMEKTAEKLIGLIT